jgi:hypothetical protein
MSKRPCALYTPVFDNLIHEIGLIPALVFGLVWRYAHMSDGVCRASCQTVGQRLGLSRVTILRTLHQLCEARLVEDLTPGLRNRPHILRPTSRALALIARQADLTCDRINTEQDRDISQSDTGMSEITPGVSESDSHCIQERHPAVSESDMNQTLLRDQRNEDKLSIDQVLDYRARVTYANQNILTFNRCKAVVYCRFERITEGRLVISHPDAWFLSRVNEDFRSLYEKTLSQYLPEREVNVEFVLREVIDP